MHYAMEGAVAMSFMCSMILSLLLSKIEVIVKGINLFAFLTEKQYILCTVIFSISLWGLIYSLIYLSYSWQDRRLERESFWRKISA